MCERKASDTKNDLQVFLKGAISMHEMEKAHWALKKSVKHYLMLALSSCLSVSMEQVGIKIVSMGERDVRAFINVVSPSRIAILADVLGKKVINGDIAAFAQQAVQEDYKQVLGSMMMAALYWDKSFPPGTASIWGASWKKMEIDERIIGGVQWIRPGTLLQNIQAKEEILKSTLEGMFTRVPSKVGAMTSNRSPFITSNHPDAHNPNSNGSFRRRPSAQEVALGLKRVPSFERSRIPASSKGTSGTSEGM